MRTRETSPRCALPIRSIARISALTIISFGVMADDTNHGSGRDLMERHVETGDGGAEREKERGRKGQRAEEREKERTHGEGF